MNRTLGALCLGAVAAMIVLPAGVRGQGPAYNGGVQSPSLVSQIVNDNVRVALLGNTRPEATAANDQGLVPDSLPMEHMLLQLQRPPELEEELVSLIDEMNRPGSPQYHQWLTPADVGRRFGLSPSDIAQVTGWLTSHGFQIDSVLPSGMVIEFSGTAGEVRRTFQSEIHALNVNGEAHIANMSDPQIPSALAGVVKGVVSLHDFRPRTHFQKRSEFQVVSGTSTYEAVAPADLATIYNLNPLFSAGVNGAGQTIVVIEDTLLKNTSDVTTFRSAFGLAGGSFSQKVATGAALCQSPGVNADEGEAALDAEWAGAAAPGANVVLAACADNVTTFGGLIALQNLINVAPPPPIVSISYGECEAANGAAANAAYVSAYQQAAAEGTSVFVSSGDEGAASCDANQSVATHGIAVSGFASTPYNVAVGGTDFGDLYAAEFGSPPLPLSTYWNSSNTTLFESAKSYIPEIPWNDSCASQLIFSFEGYGLPYGAGGFCNTAAGKGFRTTASASGGPSAYSAQPLWQTALPGLPTSTGGARYLPDVSLFAANGIWGHFFVYCLTDTAQGGVPCDYTNANDTLALAAGGTSFSSPIMAGIMALANQHAGGNPQGNPNPRLYAMASAEYGASGNSACNSSLGAAVGSSCFFYDVTQGDIDVNCTGVTNCYGSSRSGGTTLQGALSVSSTTFSPAFPTDTGWDFATGIGTLNAYNLVYGWAPASTTTMTTSGLNPSNAGAPVMFTATIASQNHQPVGGTVAWSLNTGCGTTQVAAGIPGVATCRTSILAAGSDTVTAAYSGDVTHLSSAGSVSEVVQATSNGGVSLSAASVTFPKQLVGTTSAAPQAIQVASTGSGALVFSAFNGAPPAATFTAGDFQVQTRCPLGAQGLAPGDTCGFTFLFSPTAAGNRATTLVLADNASGSPQTIELNGTGFIVDNPTVTAAVGAGASELQAVQNPDGGWPFLVGSADCGFGPGVSCPNTVGITGLGLLAGYTRTGSPSYLTAAGKAGDHLVALFNAAMLETPQGLPHDQDVEFLIALGQLTGNSTYTSTAQSWFGAVVAQYPNAADYVDDTFTARDAEGLRTVAAWDTASFIRAAIAVGNVTYGSAAASEVIAREADWKDTNPADRYDQCESGACGPADNPYAFDYTLAAEGSLLWAFSDLPGFDAKIAEYRSFLLAQQDPAGSWDVGDSQITAYVVVGLAAVGGTGTDTAMSAAAAFYIASQLPSGGWPSSVNAGGIGAENAEVDAEIDRALQTLFSTQPGSDVTVTPAQLSTLTFGTVSTAGLTSVVAIDPAAVQAASSGFHVVDGLAYDVLTTAAVAGRITTCFTVPWLFDAATFAKLRVLHVENGTVVDRTILSGSWAPDFARQRLCGSTTSLSSFAIALPDADTTPPSMTVLLTPSALPREADELVTVRATITVHDDRDPAPNVQLVSITSNKPLRRDDVVGATIGTDDRVFKLRADSGPHAQERTYTIVYRATDASGNSTEVATSIALAHRSK